MFRSVTPFSTLTLLAGAASAVAQDRPPMTESQVVAALEARLDSLARSDRFSGVVVLARDSTPIFQKAYGLADRESGRANNLETRFNLGSINKAFTSIAIRQLAEQGKLKLDDRLIQHLPDYPNRAVAEQVTIQQLLEHRSGIGGNIFGAPPGGSRSNLRRNADFIPLFAGEPLQFAPGTEQRYSNAGYVLLGAVVERLSGQDYYDYVRQHVYRPAGMTSTDWFAKDSLPANTARGYTRNPSGSDQPGLPRPNIELLPGRGSAAGGGYSTAGDLLAFARAQREGRIAGAPARGGMGIAGGAPGINALLETGIASNYDLVILANADPPVAEEIGRAVRGWFESLER